MGFEVSKRTDVAAKFICGYDDITEMLYAVAVDSAGQILSRQLVWSDSELDWVPMDQPTPSSSPTSSTATATFVGASGSNVQLLAANASRKQATFFNAGSTDSFLRLGSTASLVFFTVKIAVGGYYELPQPVYTGQIDAIWSGSPTGSMKITELT